VTGQFEDHGEPQATDNHRGRDGKADPGVRGEGHEAVRKQREPGVVERGYGMECRPSITETATILGIRYGQGHDIARPMPATHIQAWVAGLRPLPGQGTVRAPAGALRSRAFAGQQAAI